MQDKAPVSLCIIVKNDPLLEDCVNSLKKYVKEIVIVDTGSTTEFQLKARSLANIFEIYTECNDPQTGLIEDFSQARQRSFDLATQPWIMWMDSDDIVEGGENLNKIITNYEQNPLPLDGIGFVFPYEYAYDGEGRCTLKHYRERLFKNKNCFRWVNPVHEVMIETPGSKVSFITEDAVLYKHRRQYSNKQMESGRNLRILKKYVAGAGANDARQLYYLGLEYCANGFINEAIEVLIKYVNMSGWDDEKVMACLKLFDIYQALQKFQESLKWAFKAVEINEHWSEGYFALGKAFYAIAMQGGPQTFRNWQRCAHFIKYGLSLSPTRTVLFINPLERSVDIHKYLNLALNNIGDVKGALESANIALQNCKDPGLLQNKKLYEEFLFRQEIMNNANGLKNIGTIDQLSLDNISAIINNQPIKNNTILTTTPIVPAQNISPKHIDKKIITSTSTPLDIVFAIGDGVELWTPETVKNNGIGGSETMAIELSHQLAKLGHKVRVYNSCGDKAGMYDGVEYIPTVLYRNINCDVLIVSRNAQLLDDAYNISAKLKLLWVHDVWALQATNALLLKADRILALSEWHKQNLVNVHNIHPNHIIVTRNGIDLSRFDKKLPRNKFRAVNSSSPDRSWPVLLECWSEIRKRIPKAELHLYYGFKNWEYSAQFIPGHPELIQLLKSKIENMKSEGVVYHDRVSQETLAEEFLRSGCWIYPTWFSETSCISAMEAQAAGLRMITSSIAALNETVSDRGVLIDGNWDTPEYKNKFINSVVEAMQRNDGSDRVVLQKYAQEHFGFDTLAQEWDHMFQSLMDKLKNEPIIPYMPTVNYR